MSHIPVLLNEVIKILGPRPGEFFIDGTLDGGGHAEAILEKISPNGVFLGIDWDEEMVKKFHPAVLPAKNKIILSNDNFKNIAMILKTKKLKKADGLLLDLGLSSNQLTSSHKGFSFLRDEPLLMTYSSTTKPAYRWLEILKEKDLAAVIKNFGEERFAGAIARAIKRNLPIKTTNRLVQIVKSAVPKNYEHGRINPATRTFQALRIFVNAELENLKEILNQIPDILNPGGRVAMISFHSLEDRLVKNSFRSLVNSGKAEYFNKKPIGPSREEVLKNPQSRSAKLRAIRIF